MNQLWLIWSLEHRAWWRPNRNGYTRWRDTAGRYTYQQALEIVRDANAHIDKSDTPNESMVPLNETEPKEAAV